MPEQALPRVAVFTMAYNEMDFLPLWLTHYGRAVGLANLYIIDDGSTDGSTSGLGAVNVVRIPKQVLDEDVRALQVGLFHEALLAHYDVVIFTDCDELLVVDPLLGFDLRHYLARYPADHLNAFGLELQHRIAAERDFDPGRPVLAQRRFARFHRGYCKQLVHRRPVRWKPGFHRGSHPTEFGVGLYLFHLRAMDLRISQARIAERSGLEISDRSMQQGLGLQFVIPTDAYVSRYFVTDDAAFDAAVPEDGFGGFVVAALQELTGRRDRTALSLLGERILTLPGRFRETIPAVAPVALLGDVDVARPALAQSPAEMFAEVAAVAARGND